jgi:hypothetical protein
MAVGRQYQYGLILQGFSLPARSAGKRPAMPWRTDLENEAVFPHGASRRFL